MSSHILRKILAIIILILSVSFQAGCQKKVKKNVEVRKNPVLISRIKEGIIDKEIIFTGTVRSRDIVEIKSMMGGRIESIFVREGDRVKKDQIIIQMENADLKAQINQARAALRLAQAQVKNARAGYSLTASTTNTQVVVARKGLGQSKEALNQAQSSFNNARLEYNRMKNLYARGAVSKQSLDQAVTQYEISKSQVEGARSRLQQTLENLNLARANTGQQQVSASNIDSGIARVQQAQANIDYLKITLGYTTIRSPINGVVTSRIAEPGEQIAPGDKIPAMVIADNSIIYIQSDVPESDIGGLKVHEKVTVRVDSLGKKVFSGKIRTIIPSADPASRTFRIKVMVPNPDELLKNGMSAMVSARIAKLKGIVIPRHWLIKIEGEYYVAVVSKEGKVKHKKVVVDYFDEERALLTDGLKLGDEVISTGQEVLKDGDPVEVKGDDDDPGEKVE